MSLTEGDGIPECAVVTEDLMPLIAMIVVHKGGVCI